MSTTFHTVGRMSTIARVMTVMGTENVVVHIGQNRCYILKSVTDSDPVAAMDTNATYQMIDMNSLFSFFERVFLRMETDKKDFIVSNHDRIMTIYSSRQNKKTVADLLQQEVED